MDRSQIPTRQIGAPSERVSEKVALAAAYDVEPMPWMRVGEKWPYLSWVPRGEASSIAHCEEILTAWRPPIVRPVVEVIHSS